MTKKYLQSTLIKLDTDVDDSNSGFILGIVSALILIACISILLVFNNKQVRQIITEKINIDLVNQSSNFKSSTHSSHSFLDLEQTLNVKAEHPNGTIGRLTNIYFSKHNTIVEIVVTNASLYTIHLNLHGKGIVLVDDLGHKYNLKLPTSNPDFEVKSGQTFTGELVFQGGVTSKAHSLTLITNNQIGSDQPLSRRPKMEFYIALPPLLLNNKKLDS